MSFLRLQLLLPQLLSQRKLLLLLAGHLVPGGKSVLSECPVMNISLLPPSHLTLLLLVSPSALEKSRAGGRAVAVWALLLVRFHTRRISVPFHSIPFHSWGCFLWGRKKEISIFQGRKVRVNFFLSCGLTQPSECCTATVSYCSDTAAQYMTLLKREFF